MRQIKISCREDQLDFLNNYKAYGFNDRSAMVREALNRFRKELELEDLKRSAELYEEIYSRDEDIKKLTDMAVTGWPE